MGLAASQARFLAITSRKANCEFQSMQIAQNKLSVTRDLSEISEDYQNAMNQTKLVWDYNGTGDDVYGLSYDILMSSPTVLNNFNPYLITTRTGSVVLNPQYAAAARAAGVLENGSERSEAGFQKFLNALVVNGVLPQTTVTSIQEAIRDQGIYNVNAGYGAEPLSKNEVFATNIVGLAHRVRNNTFLDGITLSDSKTAASSFKVSVNGSMKNTTQASELTLKDLLENDVVFMYTMADNANGSDSNTDTAEQSGVDTLNTTVKNVFENIYDALCNAMDTNDPIVKSALAKAKYYVENDFLKTDNSTLPHSSQTKDTTTALNNAVDLANQYNSYVIGDSKGKKNNDTVAISLSNLTSYFLTMFDAMYEGYANTAYSTSIKVEDSYYVTDDPMYNYILSSEDTVNSDTLVKADYYMQIYNNICANGWTENNKIDQDEEYLEALLKNGTYFISSLGEDGYFYQGRYNETECVIEVKDEDAIAQAEAEYTAMKSKLTYKEEQLDLDLQNLDAEISSLTTEYDTVKGLIDKSVEKTFNMFQ
ncbi:hypothetical protein IJZ97_04235 [bacterium]|nr:hypothetical protein [bacterium]